MTSRSKAKQSTVTAPIADYRAALEEIEKLFDAEPGTPEFDRLDILTTLVEAYEQRHYPIEAPSLIKAILYYIESRFARYNTT